MKNSEAILCVALAVLAAPLAASGQGIEAKLGDDTTATFVVKDSNNQEILVLQAMDQVTESPNIIGGHDSNYVTSGAYGATIAGGGSPTAGYENSVTDNYGTVGGGVNNQAGDGAGATSDRSHATAGGGLSNTASGQYSTVSGGQVNSASGSFSTVAGGVGNSAVGSRASIGGGSNNTANGGYSIIPGGEGNSTGAGYAFAAGRKANADYMGCFVWGDSTNGEISCGAINRWRARASGGVWFYSDSALTTGVALATGGSAWGAVSDRAVKENFTPVDKREVLEKVAAMPIEEWNLKSQDPSIRHIGPVAQDFNGAFGFEESERHINMMDATGVTMTALQGLYEVVRDQKKEIEERDRRIEELEGKARRIDEMETRLEELARLVRGTGPAK